MPPKNIRKKANTPQDNSYSMHKTLAKKFKYFDIQAVINSHIRISKLLIKLIKPSSIKFLHAFGNERTMKSNFLKYCKKLDIVFKIYDYRNKGKYLQNRLACLKHLTFSRYSPRLDFLRYIPHRITSFCLNYLSNLPSLKNFTNLRWLKIDHMIDIENLKSTRCMRNLEFLITHNIIPNKILPYPHRNIKIKQISYKINEGMSNDDHKILSSMIYYPNSLLLNIFTHNVQSDERFESFLIQNSRKIYSLSLNMRASTICESLFKTLGKLSDLVNLELDFPLSESQKYYKAFIKIAPNLTNLVSVFLTFPRKTQDIPEIAKSLNGCENLKAYKIKANTENTVDAFFTGSKSDLKSIKIICDIKEKTSFETKNMMENFCRFKNLQSLNFTLGLLYHESMAEIISYLKDIPTLENLEISVSQEIHFRHGQNYTDFFEGFENFKNLRTIKLNLNKRILAVSLKKLLKALISLTKIIFVFLEFRILTIPSKELHLYKDLIQTLASKSILEVRIKHSIFEDIQNKSMVCLYDQ